MEPFVIKDPILASYIKMYDAEANELRDAVKKGLSLQVKDTEEVIRWLDKRLQRDWEDLEFYKVRELQLPPKTTGVTTR